MRLPWQKPTADDAFLLVKRATALANEGRYLACCKTLRKAYKILSLKMPNQGYDESLRDYAGQLLYRAGCMLEFVI